MTRTIFRTGAAPRCAPTAAVAIYLRGNYLDINT
jgi:hypothetical protein